jgi:hypothetical protein
MPLEKLRKLFTQPPKPNSKKSGAAAANLVV